MGSTESLEAAVLSTRHSGCPCRGQEAALQGRGLLSLTLPGLNWDPGTSALHPCGIN